MHPKCQEKHPPKLHVRRKAAVDIWWRPIHISNRIFWREEKFLIHSIVVAARNKPIYCQKQSRASTKKVNGTLNFFFFFFKTCIASVQLNTEDECRSIDLLTWRELSHGQYWLALPSPGPAPTGKTCSDFKTIYPR
jgi:hypothetical protein